jgi:hypothetical protein
MCSESGGDRGTSLEGSLENLLHSGIRRGLRTSRRMTDGGLTREIGSRPWASSSSDGGRGPEAMAIAGAVRPLALPESVEFATARLRCEI